MAADKKIDEGKVREIVEMMDILANDTSVPKNIRKAVTDARDRLRTNEDMSAKLGSAVYSLEGVSEDINMPMHARTQIWTILSAIESIKSE